MTINRKPNKDYQEISVADLETTRYIHKQGHSKQSNQLSSLQRDDTGPRSAVGNVSGYRCVSDCRSRGREFDPGTVPYFRGD